MPKRKQDDDVCNESENQTCIIHSTAITDHGTFIPFTAIKTSPEDRLLQFQQIRERRLLQPHSSPHRMEDACNLIPDTLPSNLEDIGYHRKCYSNFVHHLERIKDDKEPQGSTSSQPTVRKKLRYSTPSSSPLFPPECIFCGKIEIKHRNRNTERAVPFPSFKNKDNQWEQIESRAKEMEMHELYLKVKDKDLFAVEAKHHFGCMKDFRTKYFNFQRKKKLEMSNCNKAQSAAIHSKAFEVILSHVQTQVVQQNKVLRLTELQSLYNDSLRKQGYDNPNYRSSKIIKRLESHAINESLCYTNVSGPKGGSVVITLIHSSHLTVANALSEAYHLGGLDKYQDVALVLRGLILRAFKESKDIPWPPTADDMELDANKFLPPELTKFLSFVMSGKDEYEMNDKTKRIVFSIGQDLCRAVTGGDWKLPKHILLCITIRHLFRSKILTAILNRLGHCENYDFGLEVETSLAKALDEVSSHLTPQIVTGEGNEVFHCEWDNLNNTTTTVNGSNIVNSAGGIMIQEIKADTNISKVRKLPLLDRSQQRTIHVDTPESIPPLHFKRTGPSFPSDALFEQPEENKHILKSELMKYYVWLFLRFIGSHEIQVVPALGGFTSATGKSPLRKSTVEYFTPIHQPITDNAVVRELLKRSEEATAEVGQEYVLNTFDLGVCMKALPIIWRWPNEFAKHVIMIGPFHTSMNFMGMLTNHKMKGSGYAEILYEAQLVKSGSMKGVLSGKAYAKALFCLKAVCEALERLLIEQFMEEENIRIDSDPATPMDMIHAIEQEHLQAVIDDT